MKPDAIFFDLYNTLVHFDFDRLPRFSYKGRQRPSTMLDAFRELQQRWGLGMQVEQFHDEVYSSWKEMEAMKADGREYSSSHRFRMLLERLGIDDRAAVASLVEAHMERMFEMMFLPQENLSLLESLQGYPKVLASNFDHAPTARRALIEFGLDAHLAAAFISDEVGWRKPSPEFFRRILAETGYEAERCIFVGDDPEADCDGAGEMGFQVAWLKETPYGRNPFSSKRIPPRRSPRWTISSLNDLRAIVQE